MFFVELMGQGDLILKYKSNVLDKDSYEEAMKVIEGGMNSDDVGVFLDTKFSMLHDLIDDFKPLPMKIFETIRTGEREIVKIRIIHIIFLNDESVTILPKVHELLEQLRDTFVDTLQLKDTRIVFHISNSSIIQECLSYKETSDILFDNDKCFYIRTKSGTYNKYELNNLGVSIQSIDYSLPKSKISFS